MEFSKHMKSLRNREVMTLHTLSVLTNINVSLLSKFENRARLPTKPQLVTLNKIFNDHTYTTAMLLAEKIIAKFSDDKDFKEALEIAINHQ